MMALLFSACAGPQTMAEYNAKAGQPVHPRRIAIFPIQPGPASADSVDLLAQTLTAAFSARFDVSQVQPPHAGLVEPEKPTLIDHLLLARDDYGADAVLFGKIVDYRQHEPPSITMDLKLIATKDGTLLWSAAGTIDAAEPDVERRIKKYFNKFQEKDRSRFGWRVILLAERRYVQFAANEFLNTISPHWRP
jgi:hypothetical protein